MPSATLHAISPSKAGTVVTVNRRLSRQLRARYDRERQREGARVWEAADILPLDAWKTRSWREQTERDPLQTPMLLSRTQEDALWRQVIRRSAASAELLDVSATAAMAARARDLIYAWDLPKQRPAFDESPDTQAFFEWLLLFEERLRDGGWVTPGELAAHLMNTGVNTPVNTPVAAAPVWFAGFDEVALADRRLLSACGAAEKRGWTPVEGAHASLRPASSSLEEIEQAAAWARAKLQEKAGAIAVLIPGLAGMASTVERVFGDVLHPGVLGSETFESDSFTQRAFEITSGCRSDEVPVVATALLVLGLHPGLASSGLVGGLTLAEVGMLLRSPFLAFDRVRGAELDARLRRHRIQKAGLEHLGELFPQLDKVSAKRFTNGEHDRRPSEWSAVFSELVQSAGWRAPRPAERAAIDHWKDLLGELASLDHVMGLVSYEAALDELKGIARNSRFSRNNMDANEDAPVQIMDLREGAAACMNFDAVWIAGLHAGAWPEPARPNPFVPLALQGDLPHGSARWELEHAQRVTSRWLASASEVVCSFPRMVGEEDLQASPLVEELPLSALVEFAPATMLQKALAAPVALENVPDAPVPVDSGGKKFRGGASVLKHQAECPFRAFAVHRLGARELDDEEIGVSPRERGTAVHRALELLWGELKSQENLRALTAGELSAFIRAKAGQALDKNSAPPRFRNLEQQRLEHLLAEWLEMEKARAPFAIVANEEGQETEIGGIVLGIRPDRVDRYEGDGGFALIDYKTGQDLKTAYWDGDRPEEPQLPLYAVKGGYPVSEVMFGKLVPDGVKTLRRAGGELQESLPLWAATLEALAGNFAAGHAAVDPKNRKKICRLCRLQPLCRVDELGGGANGSDEEGEELDE